MTKVKVKNVLEKPLQQHSTQPMTGYLRDGYCDVPNEDTGNHSIAATVTDEFLDFTASQGNDLRKQVGLRSGDKWCLCAHRWKEAFDARTDAKDPKVPKVRLDATNYTALKVLQYADLKQFAAEPEASHAGKVPWPAPDRPSAAIRQGPMGGTKD